MSRRTYDDVPVGKLEWLGLRVLRTESLAVEISAVDALRVFEEYLSSGKRGTITTTAARYLAALPPHLRMLPTQDLGVEIAIILGRRGLCVGFAANFDPLARLKGELFRDVELVERT
jgi:hypothetical protein